MEINFMTNKYYPGLVKMVVKDHRTFREISMQLRSIPDGAIEVKRKDKFGEYWLWEDLATALPKIGYTIVDK
jgi:hypothetical protein